MAQEFDWDYADQISARITEIAQREAAKPGFQPAAFYAGMLMSLLHLALSAPNKNQPDSFVAVQEATVGCLHELVDIFPPPRPRNPGAPLQ